MPTIKQQLSSNTNRVMLAAAAIEGVSAALTHLAGVMPESVFLSITVFVASITPVLGVIMRQVTNEPLSHK